MSRVSPICAGCGESSAVALCAHCVEEGICSVRCSECGAPPMQSCAQDDPCPARMEAIAKSLEKTPSGESEA